MVVRYQIWEHRKLGYGDRGVEGRFIEAKVCDWIVLKTGAVDVNLPLKPGSLAVCYQRCSGGAVFGEFEGVALKVESTPRIRGGKPRVRCITNDEPHFIMRASFGNGMDGDDF